MELSASCSVIPPKEHVIESVVADRLAAWLDAHPRQAQAILAKARNAAAGRPICQRALRSPPWQA
jgi:DNA gyrase/topoisomerase IV subunit B